MLQLACPDRSCHSASVVGLVGRPTKGPDPPGCQATCRGQSAALHAVKKSPLFTYTRQRARPHVVAVCKGIQSGCTATQRRSRRAITFLKANHACQVILGFSSRAQLRMNPRIDSPATFASRVWRMFTLTLNAKVKSHGLGCPTSLCTLKV